MFGLEIPYEKIYKEARNIYLNSAITDDQFETYLIATAFKSGYLTKKLATKERSQVD